jgi:hypothetical protein
MEAYKMEAEIGKFIQVYSEKVLCIKNNINYNVISRPLP